MPRIKLIQEKGDLPGQHHALFDELAALRGRISGPSSVVLHSPALARPWNEIGEYLHRHSVVESFDSELALCATAREFDCDFIWAAHLHQALGAGVSERTTRLVAEGAAIEDVPLREALVVRYVRQLIRTGRVDDDTFEPLLGSHGPRWILELTAWVGRYGALAGILNAFQVEPAEDAAKLPARSPRIDQTKPVSVRTPLSAPRVAPLTNRDQVDSSDRPVFDAITAGRGSVRGPFALLLYSPELCRRVLDLSDYLRSDSFLGQNLRELAVIATARERDCPYVWAAHAPAARRAGISDSTIVIVRDRGELANTSSTEADVIEFVRGLLRQHEVEDELFNRLIASHSIPWLVELTAVVGHYFFVTSILNAFEVAPTADAEPSPLS
jgi:4-carboxymuconolactone decarboxylase